MAAGYIRAAGIDIATGKHVRPVIMGRLPKSHLLDEGGVLALSSIVDIGKTELIGTNPEIEDHRIDPANLKLLKRVPHNEFWIALENASHRHLRTIFGDDLEKRGKFACGLNVGKGKASLGVLNPKSIGPLTIKEKQIRIDVSDVDFDLNLSLTDLRFFTDNHTLPNPAMVKKANEFIGQKKCLLSVGLSRALSSNIGFPPSHWLQANNLHFQ